MAIQETTRLQGVINDIARLGRDVVRQQWSQLSEELQKDAKHAGSAALLAGGGAALVAMSGVLVVPIVAHLLQRLTRLPVWASYALIAGGASAGGIAMIGSAVKSARQAWPPELSQVATTLQEGVQQIKQEMQSAQK